MVQCRMVDRTFRTLRVTVDTWSLSSFSFICCFVRCIYLWNALNECLFYLPIFCSCIACNNYYFIPIEVLERGNERPRNLRTRSECTSKCRIKILIGNFCVGTFLFWWANGEKKKNVTKGGKSKSGELQLIKMNDTERNLGQSSLDSTLSLGWVSLSPLICSLSTHSFWVI